MAELKPLKPCPFCGSEEVYINERPSRYGCMVYIECEVCKAKSAYKTAKEYPSTHDWDTMETRAVIEMWNRRVAK